MLWFSVRVRAGPPPPLISESLGCATAECARPRAQQRTAAQQHVRMPLPSPTGGMLRPRTGALRVYSLSARLANNLTLFHWPMRLDQGFIATHQ